MKYEIKNRFTGRALVTAEIDADENTTRGVKIGLAVRWAVETGAVLTGAVLSGADLSGVDLSYAVLRDVVLRDVDLSYANLSYANLSYANLSYANLSYAILRGADLSRVDLRGAILRDADLSRVDLRGAILRDVDLRGVDLRGVDLRRADLSGVDLSGVDLSGVDLSDVDLSGADLHDVPKIENIHQSVFAAASADGALNMSAWHRCETMHCRAGWVTTLAGDAGAALEREIGPSAAAALIYLASDPTLEKIPDFHTTDEKALADMKRLAESEAA